MKKYRRLLLLLIGILILTACNTSEPEVVENKNKTLVLPVVQESEKIIVDEQPISPPDLETEQGVIDYLVGDWTCEMEYMSNIVANMTIHENLDFELSFFDSVTSESKGDYKGSIEFMRIYRNQDDAPDLISLKLEDHKYEESQYFFFHRTIYEGKRVMSLFFAGYEESIFDILTGDDDSDYTISEVLLEKITGEVTERKPRKNDQFYAIFWGHGVHYESIWLDDVEWTPRDEDYNANYPVPMLVHENEELESLLYNVDGDNKFDILGDDMFKGEVYYIETDEAGNIISLISADRKRFLEEGSDYFDDDYIKDHVFHIIEDLPEVQEYLDSGMKILYTGDTVILDGEEFYEVILGTDHEENFVSEIFYAVDYTTMRVYKYDVLNDVWEEI